MKFPELDLLPLSGGRWCRTDLVRCLPSITHEARTDMVIGTFVFFYSFLPFYECEKSGNIVFASTFFFLILSQSVKLA
jgi:hypothetical protein